MGIRFAGATSAIDLHELVIKASVLEAGSLLYVIVVIVRASLAIRIGKHDFVLIANFWSTFVWIQLILDKEVFTKAAKSKNVCLECFDLVCNLVCNGFSIVIKGC